MKGYKRRELRVLRFSNIRSSVRSVFLRARKNHFRIRTSLRPTVMTTWTR